MEDRYLRDTEVARLTGRAVQTLRNERTLGQGIAYSKIGRSVRYRYSDVVAFMERHRINVGDHPNVNTAQSSGQEDR
jgi:hypothetical protein